MKRGDMVTFTAPKALGRFPHYEGLTGIILRRVPNLGGVLEGERKRYRVYWNNGTENSEWDCYLKKMVVHEAG